MDIHEQKIEDPAEAWLKFLAIVAAALFAIAVLCKISETQGKKNETRENHAATTVVMMMGSGAQAVLP